MDQAIRNISSYYTENNKGLLALITRAKSPFLLLFISNNKLIQLLPMF